MNKKNGDCIMRAYITDLYDSLEKLYGGRNN